MSMRTTAAALAAAAITTGAGAAPFAWLPGSSQDTPETGNSMTVVDLETMLVLGSWNFLAGNEGADPLVPAFSPDGSRAYVLVGGDADDDPAGRLFVYDTEQVYAALAGGGAPTPLQTIVYDVLPGETATIEPVAATLSPDGSRLYVVEGRNELLHCYNVAMDGTLAPLVQVPTDSNPGPLWISPDGDTGFFTNTTFFRVNRVGLSGTPTILNALDITPPARFDGLAQPITNGGIPFAQGDNLTAVPVPGGTPTSNEFWFIAGYFGFRVFVDIPFIGGPLTVRGNYDLYRWNSNSASPTSFAAVTSTTNEVAFPPTINVYRSEGGTTTGSITGGRTLRTDFNIEETVPQEASPNHMLTYALWDKATDALIYGSVAIPKVTAANFDLNNFVYTPQVQTSNIYRHTVSSARTITAQNVGTVQRFSTVPLGFAGGSVIFAGNDVVSSPGFNPGLAAPPRNTQIIKLNPADNTVQTLTLDVVAGAAAISPAPAGPPPPTPTEVADALLGASAPTAAMDLNADGAIDAADAVFGTP
ncbi:MAG: hypothetical protein SF028_10670 [Candidatus Sumerlaeia bacterium]|nr:hypothetical protein [Candidatus Sumerlaeia bacterium]